MSRCLLAPARAPRGGRYSRRGFGVDDRHVDLCGLGGRLGARELRGRAIDRGLVFARIDLGQHGAGLDRLVVYHVDTRTTRPAHLAAIWVMCPSTCASSVDSRPP